MVEKLLRPVQLFGLTAPTQFTCVISKFGWGGGRLTHTLSKMPKMPKFIKPYIEVVESTIIYRKLGI